MFKFLLDVYPLTYCLSMAFCWIKVRWGRKISSPNLWYRDLFLSCTGFNNYYIEPYYRLVYWPFAILQCLVYTFTTDTSVTIFTMIKTVTSFTYVPTVSTVTTVTLITVKCQMVLLKFCEWSFFTQTYNRQTHQPTNKLTNQSSNNKISRVAQDSKKQKHGNWFLLTEKF